MTIATLQFSNHIQILRTFIVHMRRTRTMPGAQEIVHSLESLAEL